jgi:DNA-binding MarR family transcriptional regulator
VTTSWLDDERICAYDLLDETHRQLERALEAALAAGGCVNGGLFDMLFRLGRARQRRLRMSELADALALTSGGATRLVDRAEVAGLVSRAPCVDDRRVHWVTMTERGRTELERAGRIRLEGVDRQFAARLTAQEMESLVQTLAKLQHR